MSIGNTTVNLSLSTMETGAQSLAAGALLNAIVYSGEIPSGAVSGSADMVWSQQRVVNNGSNDDLDLVGNLPVTYGGNYSPVRIVALAIINKSKVSGDKLVLGNSGTNQFFTGLFANAAHVINVNAGGSLFWVSPVDPATPVAGTGDIFRINNPGSNPITYQIFVLGRSA